MIWCKYWKIGGSMKGREIIYKLNQNIAQVIKGKESVIELILVGLLSGGHILLEDVPGVGKSSLARALARTIDCDYARIQFTPDTLPSDITGVSVYDMKKQSFEYHKGPIFHNIILADEINRTTPKTQSSLLEAMEEGSVSVEGITYKLEKPFMVIATQNPIEHLGTYQLPEAQLDRFFMKLSIGYPSVEAELEMIHSQAVTSPLEALVGVVTKEEILGLQKDTDLVTIHEELLSYILNIIHATRNDSYLKLGASPRATLALIKASKSIAYIKARNYVIPDDIHQVIEAVLLHRFILSPEARRDKLSESMILKKIVTRCDIPIL